MRGYGSQWISHKMNDQHPLKLKKSKSWEPLWRYQLNTTANLANLANLAIFEVNGRDWQYRLADSSKTAPRIFIFSIVLSAEYLSYVKSIETHFRAFLTLNILSIGTVNYVVKDVFMNDLTHENFFRIVPYPASSQKTWSDTHCV